MRVGFPRSKSISHGRAGTLHNHLESPVIRRKRSWQLGSETSENVGTSLKACENFGERSVLSSSKKTLQGMHLPQRRYPQVDPEADKKRFDGAYCCFLSLFVQVAAALERGIALCVENALL